MKDFAFFKAFFVDMIFDFARRTKRKNEDGDDADNDEGEKSPTLQKNSQRAKSDGDDEKTNIPPSVVVFGDVFFCFPRNGR